MAGTTQEARENRHQYEPDHLERDGAVADQLVLCFPGRDRCRDHRQGGMVVKHINYIEEIAIDNQTPDQVIEPDQLNIPGDGYFDFHQLKAAGDFAANDPKRWRTISLKLEKPELTYEQIARILDCSKSTVHRHLQRLNIMDGF